MSSPTRVASPRVSIAQLVRNTSEMDMHDTDINSPKKSMNSAASLDLPALLQAESEAVRLNDVPNIASFFVIRKVHSRISSIKRSRFVMMILSESGMPAVVMIMPAVTFSAWNTCRGKSTTEINALSREHAKYGKLTAGWRYAYSPREAKSKAIEASRFFQLVYCNAVEKDFKQGGVIRMVFAADGEGKPRKEKAFEFRPEPYTKDAADSQCTEVVNMIRCGMVNAYLQRPEMLDRQVKASAQRAWLEGVKSHANCQTVHGRSNLHQQVQLQSSKQFENVQELLDWGADPNCKYGPTEMTALHMACSWSIPNVVKLLLFSSNADAGVADINGMTPLHLACVFGCLESVKALLQKQPDVNAVASTPLGTLRPLDCAMESDCNSATEIWKLLLEQGAEKSYLRRFQPYPQPFPMHEVGPFVATIMSLSRSQQTESLLGIDKAQLMIDQGANTKETDSFGLNALHYATSAELTGILLKTGLDPNGGVSAVKMIDYAKSYAGRMYAEMFVTAIGEMQEVAFPATGQAPDEAIVAQKMALISCETKHNIIMATQRALMSGSLLAEALLEGKYAKALVLIQHGANPLIFFDKTPDLQLDLSAYVTSAEFEEQSRAIVGDLAWNELGRLLQFSHLYIPNLVCIRGTQLLQSIHSSQQSSAHDENAMLAKQTVLEALLAAESHLEPVSSDAIDAFRPSEQEMADIGSSARKSFSSLLSTSSSTGSNLRADQEEALAVQEVMQTSMRERARSNAGDKIRQADSWYSYRERTMSTNAVSKREDGVVVDDTVPRVLAVDE
eukprot:m.166120 g.166120  ORF g.166120 m.166120 type:complete len:789 (-) comp31418_c0_seq1:219-2585(-)